MYRDHCEINNCFLSGMPTLSKKVTKIDAQFLINPAYKQDRIQWQRLMHMPPFLTIDPICLKL